jgi:Ca-activated chloride channel family protein
MTSASRPALLFAFAAAFAAGSPAAAQGVAPLHALPAAGPAASHLVIPQARAFPLRRDGRVAISEVNAAVSIVEQVAATTLEIGLSNPGSRQEEAELLVPVPDGAVVSSFLFEGPAAEPTARLLPRAEARALYDSIVRQLRDPALLEFAGYNFIRSSVFPVPAGGTQRVRLTYEQVLPADGPRVDYVLPRSEALESAAVPWKLSMRLRSSRPISTAYSPSHAIASERRAPGELSVRVADGGPLEAGPFRLSYLLGGEGVTASLLAYPDPAGGGGYFLLLAGLPASIDREQARKLRREVILVIDCSGSMRGEKLEQAREAARQVVEGLEEGEAFNIIDYATAVSSLAPRPLVKSAATLGAARAYLDGLRPTGGTNIHDALVEALRQPLSPGLLPLTLFLTDGLPTIGVTDEAAIRTAAEKANVHGRRLFTFGVGHDVNAPLLSSLAGASRAASAFVLPGESVEVKVAQVFRRLYGPVLAEPRLEALAPGGAVSTTAVRELLPRRPSDLFDGDQLVVLGQYRGNEPLELRLSGRFLGAPREFRFRFALDGATTRNSFVPRLWASRKIGELVDAIRELGAGGSGAGAEDPRFRELVDEIVRLSTEHGVLSEYTSFLALEGTDLRGREAIAAEAGAKLDERAVKLRSGAGAVSQEINKDFQRAQVCLNRGNVWLDDDLRRVEVSNVQQIHDRTFFRRGGCWVDARLLQRYGAGAPDEVVEFGSEGHRRLVEKLVGEGRQGVLALRGETLLQVEGRSLLLKGPAPSADQE